MQQIFIFKEAIFKFGSLLGIWKFEKIQNFSSVSKTMTDITMTWGVKLLTTY